MPALNSDKKLIPVSSPIKGINRVVAREGQPPDTCWNALNVIPFDRFGRKRISARYGLSEPYPAFTDVGWIQNLSSVNSIIYPSQSFPTVLPGTGTVVNPSIIIPFIYPVAPSTTTVVIPLTFTSPVTLGITGGTETYGGGNGSATYSITGTISTSGSNTVFTNMTAVIHNYSPFGVLTTTTVGPTTTSILTSSLATNGTGYVLNLSAGNAAGNPALPGGGGVAFGVNAGAYFPTGVSLIANNSTGFNTEVYNTYFGSGLNIGLTGTGSLG